MTDSAIARIPIANIRVPRAEFAALWAEAERLCAEQADLGITDWYAGGVAATCEWLAGAGEQRSPVSGRGVRAYEELIEAECRAVEGLLRRVPPPPIIARRPGWIEAIDATLRWAWRHAGPLPLAIRSAEVS